MSWMNFWVASIWCKTQLQICDFFPSVLILCLYTSKHILFYAQVWLWKCLDSKENGEKEEEKEEEDEEGGAGSWLEVGIFQETCIHITR